MSHLQMEEGLSLNKINEGTPQSSTLFDDDSGYLTTTPCSTVSQDSDVHSNEKSFPRNCIQDQIGQQCFTPRTYSKSSISIYGKRKSNRSNQNISDNVNVLQCTRKDSLIEEEELELHERKRQCLSPKCETLADSYTLNASLNSSLLDSFGELQVEDSNDDEVFIDLPSTTKNCKLNTTFENVSCLDLRSTNTPESQTYSSHILVPVAPIPPKGCVTRLKLKNNYRSEENRKSINYTYSRDLKSKCKSLKSADHSRSFILPHQSLVGSRYIDFLLHLGEYQSYEIILSKIFAYLEAEDLVKVFRVSPTWRKILTANNQANLRRLQHLEVISESKENLDQFHPKQERVPGKGVFTELQNIMTVKQTSTPPRSPPVSPSKVRFHLFLKAGGSLEKGSRLVPCPRCSLPSHTNSIDKNAQCSAKSCQYLFCCLCLCESHDGRPCPASSTPIARKRICSIGSKESKKNLRRL